MPEKDNNALTMPMNESSNTPMPNIITALVKENGHVTGYQLSDGTILGKPEAVALAKQGGFTGVGIAHRNGEEYLKSYPDDTEDNNLSSLPSVEDLNKNEVQHMAETKDSKNQSTTKDEENQRRKVPKKKESNDGDSTPK